MSSTITKQTCSLRTKILTECTCSSRSKTLINKITWSTKLLGITRKYPGSEGYIIIGAWYGYKLFKGLIHVSFLLNPLSLSFFPSLFYLFLNSYFSFKHFIIAFDSTSSGLPPPPKKKNRNKKQINIGLKCITWSGTESPVLTIPHIFLPPHEIPFLLFLARSSRVKTIKYILGSYCKQRDLTLLFRS